MSWIAARRTLAGALIALAAATAWSAPTKIQFWHIGTAASDKGFYQGVVDAYMKAHPDVKIEMTILENEAFKSKLTKDEVWSLVEYLKVLRTPAK